jgi:SAM-dependent methyltransferase
MLETSSARAQNVAALLSRLTGPQLIRLIATTARSVRKLGAALQSPFQQDTNPFSKRENLQDLPEDQLRKLLSEWLQVIAGIVSCMVKTHGAKGDYDLLFRALHESCDELGYPYMQVVFELHSLLPFWSATESRSGIGSGLEQTALIRSSLPNLLSKYHVQTLLDAGCGDFHWARNVELASLRYIGVDIVADIIATNLREFSSANIGFLCGDITQDELPEATAILCRDCLFHLSFEDVAKAITNFKKTGAQYLFTSTFPGLRENQPIPTGHFHPINFEIAPYDFPEPLELVPDAPLNKSLGVWKFSDITAV